MITDFLSFQLSDGIWEFHSSDFPTRRIWATDQQIVNAQSVLNSESDSPYVLTLLFKTPPFHLEVRKMIYYSIRIDENFNF